MRPGITDLASIKFRDEATMLGAVADPEAEYVGRVLPEKIRLAKEYVRNQSFRLDAAISGAPSSDCCPANPLPLEIPVMARSPCLSKCLSFRPSITEAEIGEVVACLRSGLADHRAPHQQFEAALAGRSAVNMPWP